MSYKNYIKTHKWFAWRPVITRDSGLVWLKIVNKTIDESPVYYFGLLPEYTYYLNIKKQS